MIQTEESATLRSEALGDLRKYHEYRRSADALLKLADIALDRVERVSRSFDAVRVQSQPDPKSGEEVLAEAIDHKQSLQNQAREYEQKCMDIENRIKQLSERDAVVILLRVCVFRQTVEMAAEEMKYSKRQGWRLYNRALLAYGKKMAYCGTK